MPRIVHFELYADNVERAVRFYTDVFAWKIERWGDNPYWMITTGEADKPGINGGLLPRRGPPPTEGQAVNAFPCTIEVDDLDGTLAKALSAGGTLALPKMPVPGVGWLAYCKDTEGSIFGMMQPDKVAAQHQTPL